MLFPCSGRTPALATGALCLVLASLSGCASRNPLMEEPVTSRPGDIATAAAAPGATAGATGANTGVQTTNARRFLGILTPYRPDIQQGNFVSQEMVSQLKEGMTREQVRFVLGTPLLTDIFHADRWDYPFRLVKRNGETTTSRVTVYFKDNRLARFDGGDLPTEKEYLSRLAGSAPPPKTSTPAPGPQPVPSSANNPK
jgi:outer membrane protein assembly factor BamE